MQPLNSSRWVKILVWATATADVNGHFSVQLPFSLTNGQISLYVEVVDLAGNTSNPSNTLTLTLTSVTSDYTGDGYSDPRRSTVATQRPIRGNGCLSNHAAWWRIAPDLVYQPSLLRPGQRHSVPGRLRRRRQGRFWRARSAEHCHLGSGRFVAGDLVIRPRYAKLERPSCGVL